MAGEPTESAPVITLGPDDYVRESRSLAQLMARAANVSKKFSGKLLPSELDAMLTDMARVYLAPKMFFSSLLLPIVNSFCNELSFWAWRAERVAVSGRRVRRPQGWGERPNMTVALLSTSGANKSAILAELQATVDDVCEWQKDKPFTATDYTIESVMALMGDTKGTALLLLDEMKKIKATDEYKSGKQGSGNEKLMELQSGQKFRQIRKGGPAPASAATDELESGELTSTPDSDAQQPQSRARSSVHVIEARSHLNIAGTTHVHTGSAWFQAEQGATDGKMTRFDCLVVDAAYEDLPDREVMEALGQSIADNVDLFTILNVVKALRDILIEDDEIKGDIFLNDEGYTRFQAVIKETINPTLNSLKMVPAAGAQSSSYSKMKGKILKLSGALFMLTTAAELAADDTVKSFDYDKGDADDLKRVLKVILDDRFEDTGGKVIGPEAVEYAIQWAGMFHETGLALQQCMVPRQRLPASLQPIGADTDSLSFAPGAAEGVAPIAPNEKRKGIAQFISKPPCETDALNWGAHHVLMSKKFESHIVSASYMSGQDGARLVIGGPGDLTGGRKVGSCKRPTFYAIAKLLEKDGLATLIYASEPTTKQAGKRKAGESSAASEKLWGIKLLDVEKAEARDPGSWLEASAQSLQPFQLTLDEYISHCKPMPGDELASFTRPLLLKFMQTAPPMPVAAPPAPADMQQQLIARVSDGDRCEARSQC